MFGFLKTGQAVAADVTAKAKKTQDILDQVARSSEKRATSIVRKGLGV